MTISIQFKNVSKKFSLESSRPRSLQEIVLNLFSRKRPPETNGENFWVLKNVSFEVYRGETFSLIGANGAGKSTLLKLLANIIRPTHGTIYINGRISALLELGTNFHPDLTGRENIYLSGNLAGFSRSEIEKSIEAIIDFANIGRFIDAPVRHYSSGMFVRLGFSLATHINPDILIVDEVLAVGDESFQKKCFEKIHEIRYQGTTVLIVSHDMSTIRSISDRVLWMKDGQVQSCGDPDEVIQAYLADQRKIDNEREASHNLKHQTKEKIAEIQKIEFINESGQPISILETGHQATLRINYIAHERIEKPIFGIAIWNNEGVRINGPNTDVAGYVIEYIEGQGVIEYQISFLPLLVGTYWVSVGILDRTHTIIYDFQHRSYHFTVKQGEVKEMHGIVYMPACWRHITNNR